MFHPTKLWVNLNNYHRYHIIASTYCLDIRVPSKDIWKRSQKKYTSVSIPYNLFWEGFFIEIQNQLSYDHQFKTLIFMSYVRLFILIKMYWCTVGTARDGLALLFQPFCCGVVLAWKKQNKCSKEPRLVPPIFPSGSCCVNLIKKHGLWTLTEPQVELQTKTTDSNPDLFPFLLDHIDPQLCVYPCFFITKIITRYGSWLYT